MGCSPWHNRAAASAPLGLQPLTRGARALARPSRARLRRSTRPETRRDRTAQYNARPEGGREREAEARRICCVGIDGARRSARGSFCVSVFVCACATCPTAWHCRTLRNSVVSAHYPLARSRTCRCEALAAHRRCGQTARIIDGLRCQTRQRPEQRPLQLTSILWLRSQTRGPTLLRARRLCRHLLLRWPAWSRDHRARQDAVVWQREARH